MWIILCWLLGLPKLLYHCLLTLPILILYLFYKIIPKSRSTVPVVLLTAKSHHQKLVDFQRHQQQFTRNMKNTIRSVVTRGQSRVLQSVSIRTHSNQNRANNEMSRLYLEKMAGILIIFLICISYCPMTSHCLEQDAEIMKPVAEMAKAIIKTVTLGVPLEIHFDPSGLVKNFAYFTWRTGFPVSMPRGFVQKAQDFYNRVKLRVDNSEVKDVERKSLAGLKLDLDQIVDSLVDEVRQSSDGLYTDYLQTRVNGIPLEDACTAVGVQLKAYGVDLTNYRNIAGMVLGIPVMPTVASTMMNVANLANLNTMRNLTQVFRPLNSTSLFLVNLPGNALHSVSSVSNTALNSIGSLSQQLPVQNLVQSATAPLNLFRQQPALA